MIRRRHHNEAPRRAALYAMIAQLKPLGEIRALQVQDGCSTADCLEHGYIVPHDQRYSEVWAGSADGDCLELAHLGEAIRPGCIVVVMVSSCDRLARDPAESALMVEDFKAVGVTIETAGA